MLTPDQKTHFATFGFIFLKQAFSSGEIDEITVEADRLWEKAREGRPFGQEGQAIARFVEQSPGLTRMVSDERVFGAVGDLLGPDFLWAGSEGNVTANLAHGWHADRPSETESELAFTRLKINIYLDPVTQETGALRILPGSQRPSFHQSLAPLMDIHNEKGDTDPLATPYGVSGPDLPFFPLESQPGDLVFFNQSLFHAVFKGFSGRRYIALKFTANPTSNVHLRLLKQTSGFDLTPHPAFAGSDLPAVRAVADRLAAVAARGEP